MPGDIIEKSSPGNCRLLQSLSLNTSKTLSNAISPLQYESSQSSRYQSKKVLYSGTLLRISYIYK